MHSVRTSARSTAARRDLPQRPNMPTAWSSTMRRSVKF
jgi:hypothetical protein